METSFILVEYFFIAIQMDILYAFTRNTKGFCENYYLIEFYKEKIHHNSIWEF